MNVAIRAGQSETQAIIEIDGEVDMYTFGDLQNIAFAEIDRPRAKILLDFSHVEYLDSSGVGCVIRILQRAKLHNTRIAACGLNGTPLKVLQLSHVLSLLATYETRVAATTLFLAS
jgi:anti-anti-sigma factor